MSNPQTTIDLLQSIDQSLKALVAAANRRAAARGSDTAPPPDHAPAADDRDLDGKYGDPQVRFLPRDWAGEDFKGCNFSTCPPELLDMLAKAFDYFAKKDTAAGDPKAHYKLKDAARARGWAKRIRGGWRAPGSDAGNTGGGFEQGDSVWPTDDTGFDS